MRILFFQFINVLSCYTHMFNIVTFLLNSKLYSFFWIFFWIFLVVPPVRFERTTHSLEGCYSIQLSYEGMRNKYNT